MKLLIRLILYISSTIIITATLLQQPKSAEMLAKTVVKLTGDRPLIILMDNSRLGSMKAYWDSLKLTDKMGQSIFVYNPFLLQHHSSFKVKPNALKTKTRFTSFARAYICFLDVSHTPHTLEEYLRRILHIGHGRSDVFIFIGIKEKVTPILKHPLVRKFRNVIGIAVDDLSANYRPTLKRTGRPSFTTTQDFSLLKWIPPGENGLSGHHFRVSGTDFPPYMYYVRPEDSKSGQLEFSGTNYNIIKNGAIRFNYTFSINHPSTWKLTGQRASNGTWNGVFGDLVYSRAEIASVSTPNAERNGLADFIGPFGKSNLVFISAKPIGYAESGKYSIFHPFQPGTWILLFTGFLTIWFLISMALKLRFSRGVEHGPKSYVQKAFILAMSFSLEQEMKKPKGFTLRYIMISWVAFMMVVATSYRYNLAAFILAPQPDKVPTTFEQLHTFKDYKIIFDLGGVTGWDWFTSTNNPKIKSLVKRAWSTEDTSGCTTKAFMDIKTVCAGWDFSLHFAASKNLTITLGRQAYYTSKSLSEAWFVFSTENNSVFTNEFQMLGQTFYESGFLGHWERNILREQKFRGLKWLKGKKNSDLYNQFMACTAFCIEHCIAGRWKRVAKADKRIRKISRIVQRKISMTKAPSGSGGGEQDQAGPNVITVTFLP
ncbi:unnamed protein product [Orchesella dallaii]|uniref:Uncharacterized protein n=1 Tax=Orchesella dallaii TaxID=48710 RepID=A0ABP1PN16_9HEXA